MRQMMEMDGDWCEERPTLIDSYGWALNPECFYLMLPMHTYPHNAIGGNNLRDQFLELICRLPKIAKTSAFSFWH